MDFSISKFFDLAIEYGPSIMKALVVLFIGLWVIGKLSKFFRNLLVRNKVDEDLVPFLTSLVSVILKVLLLFSVAEMVGIKTTSFIAMLAAAGFAIGMALQGSLGNFASGVLVLLFKPYKTGDLIEVDGQKGWVQEIQIFNTTLKTVTNQNVIIPNSKATGDTIINHSSNGHIRVDLFFAIPYAEDFDKVEKAMMKNLGQITAVLTDPAPKVGIQSFESHNINVGVFLYATPADYWSVYYDANQVIKQTLGENNIKMAYSEGIELGDIGKQ